MEHWQPGYTQSQLDAAQERYGLRFPPDLVALFLQRRPAEGYDWHVEDPRIREMLEWPYEALLFDIENGLWWPDWGARPAESAERAALLRGALAGAPRLIPLVSHRFLPETPVEAGNPVISMHGFDTIYYGPNLEGYFANEFEGIDWSGPVRHIPFWSDIIERFEEIYPASVERDD